VGGDTLFFINTGSLYETNVQRENDCGTSSGKPREMRNSPETLQKKEKVALKTNGGAGDLFACFQSVPFSGVGRGLRQAYELHGRKGRIGLAAGGDRAGMDRVN